MRSGFCNTQNIKLEKNLAFLWKLETFEADLEICFSRQSLAMMKLAPIGFLSILRIKYILGRAF